MTIAARSAAISGSPGRPYDSGRSRREQGISEAGNRRARKLAIELAWLWVRHQPDSELSCWFRRRVGDMKGRLRCVAIVALARKRMAALWRYLETRRGADRRRAASEPLNGRAQ